VSDFVVAVVSDFVVAVVNDFVVAVVGDFVAVVDYFVDAAAALPGVVVVDMIVADDCLYYAYL
jgi:hypothetical protein